MLMSKELDGYDYHVRSMFFQYSSSVGVNTVLHCEF